MTYASTVLGLDTTEQRRTRYVQLCRMFDGRIEPCQTTCMFGLGSIDDTVVDLITKVVEGPRRKRVPRKTAKRLGTVETLSCSLEVALVRRRERVGRRISRLL